jgi:acyl-CoA synthetase (AMP-forming)/AMP-acid ligase II
MNRPNANIARHLSLMAGAQPGRAALKVPRGTTAGGDIDYLELTFAELAAEVAAWRARLAGAGVRRGDRTLVMVRPGLPLIASVFALFETGAVPVVIDPGMGLGSFLNCVERSRPRVLLGIPIARLLRHVFRGAFRSVEVTVGASSSMLARLADGVAKENPVSRGAGIAESAPTDLASILFTSGSTGAPKGVCYEHGMFEAQVNAIRRTYNIEPGEVDLPLLPIFALFNPALGMTTIVPEIDPRRPASLDPGRVVRAIRQERVTNAFGSPTLWRKVFLHCEAGGIRLEGVRRILCAGAPVDGPLYELSRRVLVEGELHSPYGATEALPVSSVSASQALSPEIGSERVHRGTFVGRPVPGVEVRIIAVSDLPIASIDRAQSVAVGAVGEIVVRGPMVTREYDSLPEATALAKIADSGSTSSGPARAVWHRMGDCGCLDAAGGLWFCGRKAERVRTESGVLHTDPCEQVFRETRPGVRFALIGLGEPGKQHPAMVVETEERSTTALAAEVVALRGVARSQPHTAGIRTFFFRESFPVDVRHNAKIHRLALARWAATAKPWVAEE